MTHSGVDPRLFHLIDDTLAGRTPDPIKVDRPELPTGSPEERWEYIHTQCDPETIRREMRAVGTCIASPEVLEPYGEGTASDEVIIRLGAAYEQAKRRNPSH